MQADSPIFPGAKLEKLVDGFEFTEGPAADTDGNIFFTDQPSDRILKWSVASQFSTFLQPSGRANGLYFDHQGNIIACADEKNELWSISPSGQITVLVKDYESKLLNGPNDVWVRPDDGIYFTDPYSITHAITGRAAQWNRMANTFTILHRIEKFLPA
jgi:gluconolactonase